MLTQVQLWYNRFKKARESVNDDARHGRPSMSTTEAVKKMILDNRRITVTVVANDVGILFGSGQEIFTDVLGMKRVAAKIVPKLLNFEQKQEMLTTFKDDPDLIKKFITGDESWIYGYDIETKSQSSKRKRPEEPKKHFKFGQR